MHPEKQPANRRSASKHRIILAAAAACVQRNGYAATTIEAIAAEAGVGKQTIYRWWPSKATLFVEVYTDIASRKALTAPQSGTTESRLAEILKALFALYRETSAGAILAGLIGDSVADGTTRTALAEGLIVGRADIVSGIVRSGVAREELSCLPEVVNEVVVALVWKRLVMNPEGLDDAFAEDLAAQAIAAGRIEGRS